jgi:excisionase family DNA binding protein
MAKGDNMKPEPWSSLEEIAVHLGVSQDTVHRWIRRRKMPAHKVGHLWKFKTTEVDEWVRLGKAAEPAEDSPGNGPREKRGT